MTVIIYRQPKRVILSKAPVSGGWWDNNGAISGCLAAYQPKGAADLSASYINRANPGTYDAAPGVAPAFATGTGWTFNGATSNRKLLISVPCNIKPFSIVARITPTGTGTGTIIGPGATGGIDFRVNTKIELVKTFTAVLGTSTATISGGVDVVVAVTYDSSGNYIFYKNGASGGSGTNNVTFVSGTSRIGMDDSSSGNREPFNGVIAAVSIYNTALSSTDIATITTLSQAL